MLPNNHDGCKLQCNYSIVLATFTTFAISTPMATHTVFKVTNTLLPVLRPDSIGRVLMAAVAGVFAVVIFYVASIAFHVVIRVE